MWRSRPITLRIIDPRLKCSAWPGRGSAAKVYGGRETPLCNSPVDRRATESRDAHDVAKPIKGGRFLGRVWSGQGLVKEHGGSLRAISRGCVQARLKQTQDGALQRAGYKLYACVGYPGYVAIFHFNFTGIEVVRHLDRMKARGIF